MGLIGGIQASELKFLCRGKAVESSDIIAEKGSELSVMLLFKQNFHVAEEGIAWLRESQAQLVDAEAALAKLAKRVEANLVDDETSVRLAEVGAQMEVLLQ